MEPGLHDIAVYKAMSPFKSIIGQGVPRHIWGRYGKGFRTGASLKVESIDPKLEIFIFIQRPRPYRTLKIGLIKWKLVKTENGFQSGILSLSGPGGAGGAGSTACMICSSASSSGSVSGSESDIFREENPGRFPLLDWPLCFRRLFKLERCLLLCVFFHTWIREP